MTKRDVSAIVSGAGWIGGFVFQLVNELRARGCTDEEIHSLVTWKGLPAMGKIADSVVYMIREAKNTFRLTKIGDGRTTEELVRDGGYKLVHSNINSRNFPVRPRHGYRDIVLLEFDRDDISLEEVISEAEKLGLKRPTYEDAFYLGVEHPDVPRNQSVVFLHESRLDMYGDSYVLCLWNDPGYRALFTLWSGNRRLERFRRFAFVRT